MTTSLSKLTELLGLGYPTSGVDFYVALLLDTRSVYTFTPDIGTDTLTTDSPHDYLVDTPVNLFATGGIPPAPLTAGVRYWARDIGSNTLKLSATKGGSAINITDVGSGTFTITDLALTKDLDLVQAIRKEIASYEGVAGSRQLWTPTAPTLVGEVATIDNLVLFDNTGGGADIDYDTVLVVENGIATRGDITGTMSDFFTDGSLQTIPLGDSRNIRIRIRLR